MFRGIFLAVLLLALPARAQQDQQSLVDRAALAVQEVMTGGDRPEDAQAMLRRARAVLVGRDGGGSWSSPAFYQMSSASVGLQAGIQDAAVVIMVMSERGLNALMDSQFKLGADAAATLATLGAGIQGGTTAAAGADFVAVARSRGLFAGLSLQGSVLTFLPDYVRAYYGRDASARQIVVAMEVHNPGSDPLRAMLMRFGSRQ